MSTISFISLQISILIHSSSCLPSSPLSQSPIPISQLYEGKMLITTHINCSEENIVYINYLGQKRCLINKEVTTDYTCRYDVVERPSCYCCGEIYSYIELGRICTKFCKKNDIKNQKPVVGQEPIIELPFSWGEGPDRVELEEVKHP
eukprot:TRINITY_DN20008_c0_g1_i2.p1 TRINITY_DN20008_c0_g1~~TRINITY_DN20008_c0_g1_i2.p1  ORF type:complete len:147 (-),score=36.68 TRINITY_DN20008_c0_g1_i2:93-533(-)